MVQCDACPRTACASYLPNVRSRSGLPPNLPHHLCLASLSQLQALQTPTAVEVLQRTLIEAPDDPSRAMQRMPFRHPLQVLCRCPDQGCAMRAWYSINLQTWTLDLRFPMPTKSPPPSPREPTTLPAAQDWFHHIFSPRLGSVWCLYRAVFDRSHLSAPPSGNPLTIHYWSTSYYLLSLMQYKILDAPPSFVFFDLDSCAQTREESRMLISSLRPIRPFMLDRQGRLSTSE